MLRHFVFMPILVGHIALGAAVAVAAPNLVVIMADDMGWADTSNPITTMGDPSDFYETPAIDQLAAEGMAFTNAYSSGPNCAPTRAAILTGQYAPRPDNNIYNVDHLNRGGKSRPLWGPPQGLPSGVDAIPNRAVTFAEVLQDIGYRTCHVGKFHVTEVGDEGAQQIVDHHGFHVNYGGTTAGHPHSYHAHGEGDERWFPGGVGKSLSPFASDYSREYVETYIKPYSKGTPGDAFERLIGTRKHLSNAITDAAIDFIETEKSGPFFLQFNPYSVHTPIQGRSDLVAKYRDKPPGKEDNNVGFGALIEGLDQSVARLIKYLKNTPDPQNPGQSLDKNTIVFFHSDNGGAQPQSNNSVLKGSKGELDEGGIRIPMIAWSGNPELVAPRSVRHTPVASIDFYPTLLSIAGASQPEGITLDGEDLSALLKNPKAELASRDLFWHFPGYLNSNRRDQRPQTAMRSDDWKLLYNYEDQSFELYDLARDLSQSNDLSTIRPEVVSELGGRMISWLAETKAPLATIRSRSLTLHFNGEYYQDGQIKTNQGPLKIEEGQEAPFILPQRLHENVSR